jgi:hypothetical protein
MEREAVMAIIQFVAGRTYYTRSVCDHNCIITVKVVSRTAKTIRAETSKGLQTLRVSEYRDRSGLDVIEQVKPWGSYSMAPIVEATDLKALAPAPEPTSVLKAPPMSLQAMDACLEAARRAGRPQTGSSVTLNDGSRWLWDARFNHWACTRAARPAANDAVAV